MASSFPYVLEQIGDLELRQVDLVFLAGLLVGKNDRQIRRGGRVEPGEHGVRQRFEI
jgi:hypothetical protein